MNANATSYNRFLLLVAGLGGLLFGIDVGIISGALPYLEATSGLTANNLSFVAAAVLLGGMISTLFAGLLSDWLGRKTMMIISGVLFVLSVPTIALSHSFEALVFGRLLQGISGGLIGVVVPLYLAECLAALNRGKGTGVFQWLLTLGFVVAALIGLYFSARVEEVAKLGDPEKLLAMKDRAWRGIFWVSLPPGILFVIGSFLVSESPRWLFRRGRKLEARLALLRSRSEPQAELELREMEEISATEKSVGARNRETLWQRKYVVPFVLACIILACNQATGINSIIIYNTAIFIQAGFTDKTAHLCTLFFTITNFLATIGAIVLVDRKGRKFLLSLGSAGVIVSLLGTGVVFQQTEVQRVDVSSLMQHLVATNQTLSLKFDDVTAKNLLAPAKPFRRNDLTLVVIYAYGDFRAATKVVRSDAADATISINRASCVPVGTNRLAQLSTFINHPLADLEKSRTAPLKIEHAIITPVPSATNGWLTAVFIYAYMAFFAVGPGVCVWLALSELMPTRIRSNGMSVALLLNHSISTTIAAVFLPTVGQHGYATMFFIFAGCTAIYFITATFFLPETKGKTLEEIEEYFEGKTKIA
jgi:MFS family permease